MGKAGEKGDVGENSALVVGDKHPCILRLLFSVNRAKEKRTVYVPRFITASITC